MRNLIIGIVGLFLGIILTITIKRITDLSISNNINIEINPFEIFSLLTTIFIAIYVTRTLAKKNEKEKEEKKLITEYINDFKIRLSDKMDLILEKKLFDTTVSKSELKILRKKLNSIISISEKYNFIEKNNTISTNLKEILTDIWEVLTDTFKEEEYTIKKTSVETSVIKIDELLFELIIKINGK